MNMKTVLDRDTLMGDVEEIRRIVVNNFETLDTIVIMWETTDNVIHHRAYGASSNLIGLLAKAQYILLRGEVG